jgi:hypothetical protein
MQPELCMTCSTFNRTRGGAFTCRKCGTESEPRRNLISARSKLWCRRGRAAWRIATAARTVGFEP